MILDVRTMGILSGVTPVILGTIMLVYLRKRKSYGGFEKWVRANFGLGIGYLFVALRGFIPDFLSIILGNILVVYSAILVYEGVQRFYGRPTFSWLNYSFLGVYIPLQSYFTYLVPNINARVALSSLVMAVLVLHSGMKLFQYSIPELKETSQSAGYLFIFTALFPFIRGIFALLQPEPIDFFHDVLNSWFSVVFIVSIVAWTFFFFFLNSARLELDLETARVELDLLARTDPLTNLYNRRHFDEHAEIEFEHAKRHERSLSFLFVDIDNFKLINDTYGHIAGDKVLLSISATIQSLVRAYDLVARYGGDEFIIMLMDAGKKETCAIAERMRKAVEKIPVEIDSGSLHVCLSTGVATLDPGDMDLGMVLKRGDDALYQAKQQGRNRVVMDGML